MLYLLLIVLAFIIDSPWPVVAGIVLFLVASWPSESALDRWQRKQARARRRLRK